MIRQSAEVENDMNGVERVVHYATSIEQEAPHEIKERKPQQPWPSHGEVEFKNVVFKYRSELPPVLKNISMTIRGGEKIGIVGRRAQCIFPRNDYLFD
jgi:ABC-type bacteriocin/lantibiotic exporter with double-glycine peptidase domain